MFSPGVPLGINVMNCKIMNADNINSSKIDMRNGKISNVGNPTQAGDVATKQYVDTNSGGGSGSWKKTVDVCATQDDMNGSLYSEGVITWSPNRDTLDGVDLEPGMTALIAAYTNNNVFGIYDVTSINPTVLTISSETPIGTLGEGTMISVSGSLSGSNSYCIFMVPAGADKIWGSEDIYLIKYYRYLIGENNGSILVSNNGIPDLTTLTHYENDEVSILSFYGDKTARIDMGYTTIKGGNGDCEISAIDGADLTLRSNFFEVVNEDGDLMLSADAQTEILTTECGISSAKPIVMTYSSTEYNSDESVTYTPSSLLGGVIYRSGMNSPALVDFTPTASEIINYISEMCGSYDGSGIKFTVINSDEVNPFVISGGDGVTTYGINKIEPGGTATFLFIYINPISSQLHNLSKFGFPE